MTKATSVIYATLLLMLMMIFSSATVFSASTGATSASTFANTLFTGYDANWSNTNNAAASDNIYTSVNITNSAYQSAYLKASAFNFSSIPSNAVINGIEVKVAKNSICITTCTSSSGLDNNVTLVKNGVVLSTNKASTTPWSNTTNAISTYGNSTDLWGTNWTVGDLKNSTTGFAISAGRSTGGGRTDRVDQITMNVYYTVPATKSNQTISFASLSPKTYGDDNFTLSATATSGLTVAFSTVSSACSVTGTSVHIISAGTCSIMASQAGNASYNAASNVSQSFTIAKATATLSFDNLAQTYTGEARTVTVTTVPSSLGIVSVTYNESSTAPTNAGSYTVDASLDNANYQATPITGTLDVAKATATLSFDNLAQTYDGAARTVSVTTNPSSLDTVAVTYVSDSYESSTTAPTNAGSYTVDSSLDNANYEATPITDTLNVAKANPVLTISADSLDVTYGDSVSVTGNDCPEVLTCVLTRNGDVVADNLDTSNLTVGSYDYIYSTGGNSNYNSANSATATVVVSDKTAPVVDTHSNMTGVEATGADGAVVTYSAPVATDNYDESVSVTCDHKSGSTFALGETLVTCSATDVAKNTGSSTFTVTVVDTIPPVLGLPSTIIVPAENMTGAHVLFNVSATDRVDGSTDVNCNANSDDFFSLGETLVTCSTKDSTGNNASDSFTIIVQEPNAPTVSVPANITGWQATSATETKVTFDAVTATDEIDGPVSVSCNYESGDAFPLGTTPVICSASNSGNKTGYGSFSITVVDTTAPEFDSFKDITGVEATSSNGVQVNYKNPTATDLVDSSVLVSCTPETSSTFGLGNNTVTCRATDDYNNSAGMTFTVEVVDTTAPALSIPKSVTAEATSANGANVDFTVSATDLVDGSTTVNCGVVAITPDSYTTESVPLSPVQSGDLFKLGDTTVICSSSDESDNSVRSQFVITVQDTTGPIVSVPVNKIVSASSLSGATVSFDVNATDLVDGSRDVSCTAPAYSGNGFNPTGINRNTIPVDPSGSLFPFGTTTVTCSATDSVSNTGHASFNITVNSFASGESNAQADFINLPAGKQFTFSITESNATNTTTSGFRLGDKFFNITSNLTNGEFNVTLTLSYNDVDNNGIVDGTTIREADLNVYYFNVDTNKWVLVPNPVRDKTANTITVTVDHFTEFALLDKVTSSGSSGGSSSSGSFTASSTTSPVAPAAPTTKTAPTTTTSATTTSSATSTSTAPATTQAPKASTPASTTPVATAPGLGGQVTSNTPTIVGVILALLVVGGIAVFVVRRNSKKE